MVIGEGLMLFLLWQAYAGKYTPSYYTPVDVGGLYWHFVDIIWIFLFPLLYLIAPSPTLTCKNTSTSIKTYTLVFVSLLVLTAATTVVATIDLGPFNVVMALVIAVVKMMLVALFFMHLRHSTVLTKSGGWRRHAVAGDSAVAQFQRFRHARLAAGPGQVAGLSLVTLEYIRWARARSSGGFRFTSTS